MSRNAPLSHSRTPLGQMNNNDEFFGQFGVDSAGPTPPSSVMNRQNLAQTQSTYSTGFSQGSRNSLYPSMAQNSADFAAAESNNRQAYPRDSYSHSSSHVGVPAPEFPAAAAASAPYNAVEPSGLMDYGQQANSVAYSSTYLPAPQIYNPTQWSNDSSMHRNSWNPNEANQVPFGTSVPELQRMVASPMGQFAMEYGRQLVGQTTTDVTQKIERWFSIQHLNSYFDVDTAYVIKKLFLIIFPFFHSDWAKRFNHNGEQVTARFELNAFDLYIPVMALVTYLVTVGVALGRQDRFSPELLGSYAWYALLLLAFEVLVNQVAAALLGVRSQLATGVSAIEQTACSAYKFVHLCLFWALGALSHRSVPALSLEAQALPLDARSTAGGLGLLYWLLLFYCAAASFYFAARSMKSGYMRTQAEAPNEAYFGAQAAFGGAQEMGHHRRYYLLLMFAGLQVLFLWLLSRGAFD